MKNKWRENLKLKNAYKSIVSAIECVVGTRHYNSKISAFESLKSNYLNKTDKSKNKKQLLVKEELLVVDKELELSGLNSNDNKLNSLKSTLFNNPDIFNYIFKDDSL